MHKVVQSASSNQSEIREDQMLVDEVALDSPLAVLGEIEPYLRIIDVSSTKAARGAFGNSESKNANEDLLKDLLNGWRSYLGSEPTSPE